MRILLVVLGVLSIWVGGVWVLQGTGALPGSFMSGQTFWAWAGVAAIVVGMGLLLAAIRRRGRRL